MNGAIGMKKGNVRNVRMKITSQLGGIRESTEIIKTLKV